MLRRLRAWVLRGWWVSLEGTENEHFDEEIQGDVELADFFAGGMILKGAAVEEAIGGGRKEAVILRKF